MSYVLYGKKKNKSVVIRTSYGSKGRTNVLVLPTKTMAEKARTRYKKQLQTAGFKNKGIKFYIKKL